MPRLEGAPIRDPRARAPEAPGFRVSYWPVPMVSHWCTLPEADSVPFGTLLTCATCGQEWEQVRRTSGWGRRKKRWVEWRHREFDRFGGWYP